MHITLQTLIIVGVLHTNIQDVTLVRAALFSKDFPEVPTHEAVGLAASTSAEVRNRKKS